MTDESDGAVYWYVNDGTGSFSKRVIDASFPDAFAATATSEIQGDGRVDIVVAGGDTLNWYNNLCGSTFVLMLVSWGAGVVDKSSSPWLCFALLCRSQRQRRGGRPTVYARDADF